MARMLDLVESAINALRMTPCPGCADRALRAPAVARLTLPASPARAATATWDVLAEVTVVGDRARLRGNCCSGFRHHDLTWRQEPGGREQTTRLQTWAQDHLVLRPGDVVSVLCEPGDLLAGRRDGRDRRVDAAQRRQPHAPRPVDARRLRAGAHPALRPTAAPARRSSRRRSRTARRRGGRARRRGRRRRVPVSFVPASRLTKLSNRSPSGAVSATAAPSSSASVPLSQSW